MTRDQEIAALIREEIKRVKSNAERFGWAPGTPAWRQAFGEMAGMYRILELVDPNPHAEEPVHQWGREIFRGQLSADQS
jgi:hypothetical protein